MSPDDIARLMSEDINDKDEFQNEDFWTRTFQSLFDEGGIEQLTYALRAVLPSDHVLEVGENYVVMGVARTNYWNTPNDRRSGNDLRKLRIEFDPKQTISQWLRDYFIPKIKEIENEREPLNKDRHPLFFEDLSPWGNEMGKPWGWQVSVSPITPDKVQSSGEGIDDEDEFLTGDESYQVTVSNKHYPGKVIEGVVGFQEDKHFPELLSLDRNDWGFGDEFAAKVVWSSWWASDEARRGEYSYEPKDLEPGEMLQMDQGGIEMLKYYNDPEYYNNSKHPKSVYKKNPENPSGWGKVGTHTYGEGHETPFTKYVNGKIFTRIYEQDLMNLFMNTWYWTYPGAPDTLYKLPDEIIDDYPLVFIHWAMPIEMSEFFEEGTPPPPPENTDPDSVDDRDEFDADDPEVDLQKWKDAEQLAASAAHERMLKEFATIDKGYKLLYVGAKGTTDMKMKPYAVITREDEFRNYKVRVICSWCKKDLGFKPIDDPKLDGKISHGMCRNCEVEQYRQLGMEPPPVTEDLDDKDEFTPEQEQPRCAYCYTAFYDEADMMPVNPEDTSSSLICKSCFDKAEEYLPQQDIDDQDEFEPIDYFHGFCEKCSEHVGPENMVPVSTDPIYGDLAGRVCKACKEKMDQGPVDDRWLREDLDDKDEFESTNFCQRCNSRDMVEPVYFDDNAITMEYLCRWCKKALYFEESIGTIVQSVNEDTTIDLAAFLNSQHITPWAAHPGNGNFPRFSIRPGHESECVDEESGLMDRSGRDVSKQYQEQHNIDTYIASWTPPDKTRHTTDDPNSLDDTDEFYGSGERCVVFASRGGVQVMPGVHLRGVPGARYQDVDIAVFYNGRWQKAE